jgi:glycosyltransferase involved in cell wall biosynthesis
MRCIAKPRLSIGLPVFNGERYLAFTLENLLNQTFSDFELIISDNASTDSSLEICENFAATDRRVQVFSNRRNLGAVANFNQLVRLAKAPLFKWAAHDDLHHQEYLGACAGLLDRNPDAVLAHSATAFIDDAGRPFPFDQLDESYIDPKTGVRQRADSQEIGASTSAVARFWDVLSRARWGTHMFGVIRRDALLRTGLLPNFASGDRALLAELALLGRFESVPEPYYQKRFHESVSWALNQTELKNYLDTATKEYFRRYRQLKTFCAAPLRQPISPVSKLACVAMVLGHSGKIMLQMAGRKEARNAAQGAVWRQQPSSSIRKASAK